MAAKERFSPRLRWVARYAEHLDADVQRCLWAVARHVEARPLQAALIGRDDAPEDLVATYAKLRSPAELRGAYLGRAGHDPAWLRRQLRADTRKTVRDAVAAAQKARDRPRLRHGSFEDGAHPADLTWDELVAFLADDRSHYPDTDVASDWVCRDDRHLAAFVDACVAHPDGHTAFEKLRDPYGVRRVVAIGRTTAQILELQMRRIEWFRALYAKRGWDYEVTAPSTPMFVAPPPMIEQLLDVWAADFGGTHPRDAIWRLSIDRGEPTVDWLEEIAAAADEDSDFYEAVPSVFAARPDAERAVDALVDEHVLPRPVLAVAARAAGTVEAFEFALEEATLSNHFVFNHPKRRFLRESYGISWLSPDTMEPGALAAVGVAALDMCRFFLRRYVDPDDDRPRELARSELAAMTRDLIHHRVVTVDDPVVVDAVDALPAWWSFGDVGGYSETESARTALEVTTYKIGRIARACDFEPVATAAAFGDVQYTDVPFGDFVAALHAGYGAGAEPV